MKHFLRIPVLTLLVCAAAAPLAAQKTRYWKQSAYEDFEKGTAKGVALRSDGRLLLAPRFQQYADPNLAYLWAVRADSKGRLYAAGGSNARVVRVEASGEVKTVFESQELAAQALAIDGKDNLYVGTSPDGKVYKVTPAGESSVFFEPNTKYIWDLALDSAGTLYVATGDRGEIFSVTPDGKGALYFKSDETHIRALGFDAQGSLIAGTDPSGMILRAQKTAAGVQAFVVFETARKEVITLITDSAGNLYAAAIGQKTPSARSQAQMQQQQLIQQAAQAAAAAAAAQAAAAQQGPARAPVAVPPATQFVPFTPTSGGSEVYRIGPDGAPEVLWSSNDTLAYSLGLGPRGRLLIGTGNKGEVIEIEGNNLFLNLAKTAADQVTSVLPGPGGVVYLCTANPGQVFRLGPGYEPEGTFESEPFDAKVFSYWGRLTWWGENGATSGRAQLFLRTGNTSNPEQNWSPWSGPFRSAQGESSAVPPARFAQWKVVFTAPTASASETPSIGWVSVAYLPKNIAPVVDAIAVQDPGIRTQGPGAQMQSGQPQPVPIRLPQALPGQATTAQRSASVPRFEIPPQGFAQRGFQSAVWAARDENDDDLRYTLYFRGENEQNWKVLAKDLEQRHYSWETSAMPDGAYYLRVVASDAVSNPAGEGLTGERISDRFEVDNTPPSLVGLRARPGNPEARIEFQAVDSYSAIARAEYSLNAGEWTLVMPEDRLSDSPQEKYTIVLKGLAPGEHTVAIRMFDQFENTASAKVTFVVEAARPR